MRLILIASAWVIGISVARPAAGLSPAIWLLLPAPVIFFALFIRSECFRWFAIAAVVFALGAARQASLPQTSDIAQFNGSPATISGIVMREPVFRDDRVQLRIQADSIFVNNADIPTSGGVLVESYTTLQVDYGDRVRATGRLALPATWDTFSYADYLGRQGLFSIMSGAAIEVTGSGHGSPIVAALLRIKRAAHRRINAALPEPQAGLLSGILLGDERNIARPLQEDFQRVAAAHIVAISGFNMVVISAIVSRVAGSLLGGRRAPATISAIIVIFLYSILVGASGGILRAALMSSLLVIGRQLKRRTFLPASLAFATLVLSLLDPGVLLDVGFQLSFCAVLGIGLLADPMSLRLRTLLERFLPPSRAHRLHDYLNEPLIVSFAAQVTTLPLAALYFGRLSLVALPVNLLIVPAQPVILITGLLAVACGTLLPQLGALLLWIDMVFLSWTIAVVRAFAAFAFADIAVAPDPRMIQACYLLLMGGVIVAAARPSIWTDLIRMLNRRRAWLLGAALIVLILQIAMFLSRGDGRLHVWLLDNGHSNAVLLQTPGGAQMLIDGGRFPARLLTALGDRMPYYDRHIEALVITHPDEWDIGALPSVLDRYTVGVALLNGQPNRTRKFLQIMERLERGGVARVDLRSGYSIDFGDGVLIEALHPSESPRITDKLFDHVLALRLRYGDVSFLLSSDLSVDAQLDLLHRGMPLQSSVLQIPDHGTRRAIDSDFLAAVSPQIVLLQSDPANPRGDPDPDTLSLFQSWIEQGRLFRTDELGTIHLSSDGSVIEVVGERIR